VREWNRIDPPIYVKELEDYVIADRHLPNGIRQHVVQGKPKLGAFWANAQIFGADVLGSEVQTE
jgi:hypothetical protein